MPFKVKDLMIDVTGVEKLCITGTVKCVVQCITGTPRCFCHTGTPNCCFFYCSHLHSPCLCTYVRTIPCPGLTAIPCGGFSVDDTTTIYQTETIVQTTPQVNVEQIPGLKEQLKAALSALEQREAAVNEELQPKTLEDVTLLETKLSEALEHIRAQKAAFQKKTK